MRVLLFNQVFMPDTVATALHVTDLAMELRQEGYCVTVLADKREYNHRERCYPSHETLHGIEIHRVFSTAFGKRNILTRLCDATSFLLSAAWKLLWLKRHDVMIVFTSPPMIGVLGVLLARLRGERCIQWMMDLNPHTAVEVGYLKPNSPVTRFLYALFNFSIRASDHIVVLDRWMEKRVRKHGAPPEKISIVPPWPVQARETSVGKKKNPFSQKYGIQNKFVVCYSGNHSIAHPLDTVLEAAKLLQADPDVLFLFIGTGLRVKDVSEFADRNNLTNVLQVPHQPLEMLRYSLSTADVHLVVMGSGVKGLVHPSKIYGVLATAKPYIFVGPQDSHVTDLMADFPGGFHVEHGHPEQLAAVIRRLKSQSETELSLLASGNPDSVFSRFAKEKLIRVFSKEVLRARFSLREVSP
ncbi:MAG: glycosyltransferase family 4 protein [Bdellovibrionales bacterium]|nr:glycosyltransferase family 4 protein [Bdellovibrionales bacterium]